MEEDEATMLLKIYPICRTMLDPTIVLPPRTLTRPKDDRPDDSCQLNEHPLSEDLKRTPHRLRNDPEASKAYKLDLKESETTCPSDDPSSLSDPRLLLQNRVLPIPLLEEPPLLMSRDRNPSPRGRSLNDVLLTPTRSTSTTMNRRRAPRRSSTTQSEERMTLSPSQRAEYMRHGRCFNCRQEGHRIVNCPRRPRQTPTARPLSDNPMNLPRARRFLPRNDLPSNREDLFELVVQTTTSALTQNRRIEELVPILRQLHHRRAGDISNVIADVTQLLKRDLLALVGLSEAITRIPTTPPVAPPTPAAPSRRRTHRPVVLEDTDDERTPCPRRARATLLRTGSCFECFSPGHVRINCRWYQCPMCHSSRPGHLSHLCPLRVTEELPEPSTPLMVRPPAEPPVDVATTEDDSFIGSSDLRALPRSTEENPDPNILIDSRLLTSPVLVSTAERTPPDLIVTTSVEVPTSPSNPVEEALVEERPLLEYWDVFPIGVISPTPIRHTPVGPSPLRETFSYVHSDDEEPDPVSQTPLYLDSPPESPPSSSLPSRSSKDSSDVSSSPSPVNDDTEDSARSF
ncbi:hypothetical protein BU15DRAFT_83806 [Melanogaster broomeanus]|nr:hypothetical protein BU15DRAFT_83806 [Melanogaster broomeanus]